MTAKSRNTKKPKLASHHPGHIQGYALSVSPVLPSTQDSDVPAPGKHKMSFAQHQHELELERTPSPMPLQNDASQHLKSDAQQHQQKPGSHK